MGVNTKKNRSGFGSVPLSILIVTRLEPEVITCLMANALAVRILENVELCIAIDSYGQDEPDLTSRIDDIKQRFSLLDLKSTVRFFLVKSNGYLESIHDECVLSTAGEYVFRIDDDEVITLPVVTWLMEGKFKEHDHWKFHRCNLFLSSGKDLMVITNAPLWPDDQTRLSVRQKAVGRNHLHCGSPFGGGHLAPVVLHHYKFLVRSIEDRERILSKYDSVLPGAFESFKAFSLPENVWSLPEMDLRTIEWADRQARYDAAMFW